MFNFMGYSIDAIFEEDSGAFNQPEIIGLNQSFLPKELILPRILTNCDN